MTKKPKALRLAEDLDAYAEMTHHWEAADELRRLQAVNAELTDPPKRPWVDLSDSQIEQVYYDVAKLHRGAPMPWGQVQFGNALQALVKEKNYD